MNVAWTEWQRAAREAQARADRERVRASERKLRRRERLLGFAWAVELVGALGYIGAAAQHLT